MQDPPAVTADLVDRVCGPFDKIALLGSGTFGTTFRVSKGDDEYALKVIHFANMPDYLLRREIRSLESVCHKNVVGFRRAGHFEYKGHQFPYLECEYIDGGTVEQALRDGARPPGKDLRSMLEGLLLGILSIHATGIIHRDIKPANVALRGGAFKCPVLLDFGLAKVLDMSAHTAYPQHVGTILYMSPEQLRGEPAGARSDLFAVGLLVYEAGVGRHPFSAGVRGVPDLLSAIAAPRRSGWLPNEWPQDVAKVVDRILSFHAHSRLSVEKALKDIGVEL